MKKRILSLMALAIMLCVSAINVCAAAESGDEIVLFSLDSWADDYLTIPSDLATSYQIKTNGDSNIDMLDVLLIRKFIAKQPVTIGPQ